MTPSAQVANVDPNPYFGDKVGDLASTSETYPKASRVDPARFLSQVSHDRPASAIRSLFPAELIPGMLSLLAGKPNPDTFPFESLSLNLKPEAEAGPTQLNIQGEDLVSALQYGATSGIPKLVQWITELQVHMHKREAVTPGSKLDGVAGRTPWRVTTGNGSQDLLNKTFDALLNPGDVILVESPAYTGILPSLVMIKANIVPVTSDDQGMMSSRLAEILANWETDPQTASLARPKCLYTTPTGANPAGTTASDERKRQILALARQYDFLVLEDDPYYYLHFEGLDQDAVTRPRCRSYWSLEEEHRERWGTGRVIRFESFSKILAAGLRLGFATGPNEILDAVDANTAMSNLQPSGLAGVVAYTLLNYWGIPGFLRHVDNVARYYAKRRDNFEAKANKVLGAAGVAQWVTPVAGMFLWLRLNLPPTGQGESEGDSFALISDKAKAAGVLAVPGVAFIPDGSKSCYVRTSFSIIAEDDVEEAFNRLRNVVLDAWKDAGKPMPELA
ncbi:tryptophan amino transferase (transaminase) [Mycosarcoma maydis]|uniref:Tryptophan amino transferase (Transaminase) n=1 Tax=Mycosarcoma maydis TaxID=5270 RepID=A0A0D1E3F3_MYCMD|nr:tryptophan amino transferase (transaminase) [Ustilago maydis 521]KIS70639.1 tryptophan amino transferase (transaminase) [Ustilago maydis 521]|eukprot:XP_011387757.1 tryptophan amino transferase (transaminase) [Ustilago maydis 521]